MQKKVYPLTKTNKQFIITGNTMTTLSIPEDTNSYTVHTLKVTAKSGSSRMPAQGFDVNLEIDGKPFQANYLKLEFTAGKKLVEATVKFAVSEINVDADVNLETLLGTDNTSIED